MDPNETTAIHRPPRAPRSRLLAIELDALDWISIVTALTEDGYRCQDREIDNRGPHKAPDGYWQGQADIRHQLATAIEGVLETSRP